MRRSRVRQSVASLAMLVVVACAGPQASVVGLSEARAVALARVAAPDATGVVGARVGHIHDFDANVVPGDEQVWAVVLSGSFAFSCGPAPVPGQSPGTCPPAALTETVILDYETGGFVEAFHESIPVALSMRPAATTSGQAPAGARPLLRGQVRAARLPALALCALASQAHRAAGRSWLLRRARPAD